MFAACQRALRSRHAAGQTKEKILHCFQDSICVKACTFVGLRCTVRLPTLLIVALYGFFLSVRCLNNLRHHGWLLSSVICFFYFHFISFHFYIFCVPHSPVLWLALGTSCRFVQGVRGLNHGGAAGKLFGCACCMKRASWVAKTDLF